MKTKIIFLIILSFYLSENAFAGEKVKQPINERKQWSDLCYKIAQPILENMSKGELQKNMQLELLKLLSYESSYFFEFSLHIQYQKLHS